MIAIREAGPQDRPFLEEIADRLAEFDRPAWRSRKEIADGDREALLEQIDTPNADSNLYIAELAGTSAGCLLMWTVDDYFSGRRHAHVSVIAVTREAEGRGVGRALMEHAEEWARARGHDRITLSVFEGNRRARGLYERVGYAVEMRRYVKPL